MPKKTRKGYGALWIGGLFFAAGYLVTALILNTRYADKAPTIATTLAVALTIPLASRARRVLLGALRGLGLGLATAMGIALAIYSTKRAAPPEALAAAGTLAVVVTMICCTVTGALFAYLAERRRRQLEREQE